MLKSARNSIGTVLLYGGYAAEAIPYLEKETDLRSRCNLASAYRWVDRLDDAVAVIDKVIEEQPKISTAWNTRANLHLDHGEFDKAESCWSTCLEIVRDLNLPCTDPAFCAYAFAYSTCLLRKGLFKEAWPWWENGRINRSWSPLRHVPIYCGEQDATVFLHSEGGYGDLFLFARMFGRLPSSGEYRHVLATWSGALSFAERHYPFLDVIDRNIPVDFSTDFTSVTHSTSIMSIMAVTGLSSWSEIPAYSLPRDLTARKNTNMPHIGLCWKAEEAGDQRNNRTPPPRLFDCFSDLGDWASLVPLSDTDPASPRCVIGSDLSDWTDTFKLMSRLDLVVTVDTAVAHLAAALNIPTIIIVPLCSDWKWGLQKDMGMASPWSDNGVVVRNDHPTDWTHAIEAAYHLVKKMR